MALIRGTALQGFPELVHDLGADPAALLSKAGVPGDAVGDQDSFLSIRRVIDVLESAATATATPDFGRQLATRQGVEILGPVGVAARTAASVGAALAAIEQYMSVYSPALSATVHVNPAERYARFDWRLTATRLPLHRQTAELGLGVSVRMFRLLAGADFAPAAVHFRHEPLTSKTDYARYFGCPVRFGRPATGFLFAKSILARPLEADGAVHAIVREYLSSIAGPADTRDVEPVRLLIRRMLPTGGLSITLVAAHLALHPRTLQRQLASKGTSFAALVDEERRNEAARYLRETDVPLGQLAGILGYSELSVLARACRRWFGQSASAVRRAGGSD